MVLSKIEIDSNASQGESLGFSEDMQRDMAYVEAQELGLLIDDAGEDPCEVSSDVLARLGFSPNEVGQ